MPSLLRSVAVLAFVSAVAVMSASGCSQQGEGERCDSTKNGDLDCDSGLTCVKANDLADQVTDRCCPAANTESDSRCARGTPVGSATGGSGGSSTGAAAGGEANGGTGAETAAGSPASSDGGMSSGGSPASSEGGTPADPSAGKGGAD